MGSRPQLNPGPRSLGPIMAKYVRHHSTRRTSKVISREGREREGNEGNGQVMRGRRAMFPRSKLHTYAYERAHRS